MELDTKKIKLLLNNGMAGRKMINDFQQEIANRKLRLKKDIKKTGGNCAKMLLILAIN